MAVTKTHPIKRALKAAIDYICNPEKTDAGDGDDDGQAMLLADPV